MIGLLLIPIAVMLLMVLGYLLLIGNFVFLIMFLGITAFLGIGLLVIIGSLWEWYFPSIAKMFISTKRSANSYELKTDAVGYGEFIPSRKIFPEGLIKYKYGWAFLPEPIRKFGFIQKIVGKPGKKSKDPEKDRQAEEEWERKQKQKLDIEQFEQQFAENIALKKITLKGLGKPFWLQYSGLAANFNPYILVPGEAKQDNPHDYFDVFKIYLNGLSTKLAPDIKQEILKKLGELEAKCENLRVVIDPRRFKEIHPKMFTESQIDAHGRIHEEIGRLKVSGMPLGKVLIILLVGVVIIGGLAAVYFLFMKQPPQATPTQTAQAILSLFKSKMFP